MRQVLGAAAQSRQRGPGEKARRKKPPPKRLSRRKAHMSRAPVRASAATSFRASRPEWREGLAPKERVKLNQPSTLKRKYDATHKLTAVDPNALKKESPRDALVRENEDLWAALAK